MKKVIIFDFDGVIVDSAQLSYSINKEMIPDLEYSEWERRFEGNFYKTVRKEHQNDKFQNSFFDKYNIGVVELLPISGMPEIVRELAVNFNLAIVSSGSERGITIFLNQHNLSHYFSDILGRETHKSKVEKFKILLSKYNIQPYETLIITDTVGDIKEAHEVGIRSIGVIWGVHNKELLNKHNPHFIAEKPSELIKGIKEVME